MWFLVLASLAMRHAFFDRETTRSLVKNWRPRVGAGRVFTQSVDLDRFIRAHILLNDSKNHVGSFLTAHRDLLLVEYEEDVLYLRCCLWQKRTEPELAFRHLRIWQERAMPHVLLEARLDGADQRSWERSMYEL